VSDTKTVQEIATGIADDFHDDIDSDDPCTDVEMLTDGVRVTFESGRTFDISVVEVTP
jgi:predicted NAD/FAD-binding protein